MGVGIRTKNTAVQRPDRTPGDIVKEDSDGSSASQMTAAKIMNVIARLAGCDGQADDAVSAYTQVKSEDAPRLLKIPKSECQMFGHVFLDTHGQNHGEKLNIPWYFLKETCTVIH